MRRRSRTRRVLKWVGLVGCVLIAALWVMSQWWSLRYRSEYYRIQTMPGTLCINHAQPSGGCVVWVDERSGLALERECVEVPLFMRLGAGLPSRSELAVGVGTGLIVVTYSLPLGMLLFTVAILTAVLWHVDRRRVTPRLADMNRRPSRRTRTLNRWRRIAAMPPPRGRGVLICGICTAWITSYFAIFGGGTAVRLVCWLPCFGFGCWLTLVGVKQANRYMRFQRREKGLCPGCAYNLTGNVSGVCPECGELT